jgi:hypothetical protein
MVAAVAVAIWALPASQVFAQRVAGVGEDAIPVPKGGYRLLLSGLWHDYDAVFTPGDSAGKRPVLASLATDRFGVAYLPQLAATQSSIRALAGSSTFTLSLGPLEARGEVRQSIAPLAVDYGLTSRLSLRLLVPYVESRDVSQLVLNRFGTGANVGRNPAFGTTGTSARAANGALASQIESARTALAAALVRCASPTATGCEAIRANPTAAQALLARAQETRAHLVSVYGDANRAGAPVVPIVGSSVHAAVLSTIASLRSDFGAYGITSITASAQPAPATVVLGPAGIDTIASDSSFGVGYSQLGGTRRAGIGDIDLTATYLLFDSFKADQARRLLTPTRGLRSNVTLGWRFGTAGADRTDDAFDVPIGEGANALIVRSTTDVLFNSWAWMSATVRAVRPLADEVAIRLPVGDEAGTFVASASGGQASRRLGSRLDVELAPRVALGQFFGLSAAYLARHWGTDRYLANDAGPSGVGSTHDVEARTLSAVAFGASFSTLSSYVRGRSRFPAEVVYTHTVPLAAAGGPVPVMRSDRLELRVYTGFPRR